MGVGCSACSKSTSEPFSRTLVVSRETTLTIPSTPKPITPKSTTSSIHRADTKHRTDTENRFNKLVISRKNPLSLIRGYLDEPLVSLEEALKPLDGRIDQLHHYIRQAKKNCHYPSPHGLTHDESAAIYIYTMTKWKPKSLSDHLEEAWNSNDSSKMKPWFKYLKLFQSAFDKLPDANTEIWQVIPYTAEQEEEFSSNLNKLYSSMSICLSSEKEMKEYVNKDPKEKRLILAFQFAGAKRINEYTASLSKKVMLMPGVKLGVAKYGVINYNGSVICHLVGTQNTKYRFNKFGISKNNPLSLIEGYLDEPLVSLKKSLKPFNNEINQLSYYIQEAKTKCNYPSPHGLTYDESAAIYIYTMKWKPKCLYDHLEEAWESNDSTKLKPWYRYLKLFQSAFDKLPNANTEIWQVIPYTAEHVEKLSPNSNKLYSKMGLCLSSGKELKEHLENSPGQKRILIGYQCVNGKEMADYAFGCSKEVMIWPGMQLDVTRHKATNDKSSLIFHLVGTPGKYHCGRTSLFIVMRICNLFC